MNEITTSSLLPVTIDTSLMGGKTFIGIDFGTSTTVVSISSYDRTDKKILTKSLNLDQLLPDGTRYSSEIIPSVIAWYNNQIFVGEGASQMKYELKLGKNIWYSFKMELGEDLGAKYYESELRDNKNFNICNPKDAARVFFSYLKYLILKYCKDNGLSVDILYAVSVPASFEANQRKELLDALVSNKMNVSKQSLIDEPNAAFISYAVTRFSDGEPMFISPDYNSKILVFDFGGGTCDISILEIGQDINGFYSKNISISKFMKLGGDDIDRYITYHYLLPRFLEANGKKLEDFRTNERKNIATKLYKIAERLKILINKILSVLTTDFKVPAIKESEEKTEIQTHVFISTSKGELVQDKFFLTNKELTETMAVFLKRGFSRITQIKGEEEYNSIFTPIDSAIKKSKTPKEEIDYVLFIGGSSQSPYVQEALKDYFEDSEILVPRNLRTHVSQGAAIHSLLLNGMNKCLIRPITSEQILIITKDNGTKTLLPAGTEIPCNTVQNDDLVTSKDGQKIVELPICVGNRTKLLFNLKIESPFPNGFPVNSPIKLVFEVNADKMLVVEASCMGVTCTAEPLNPFANKEMSTEERIAIKAERQANLEMAINGGFPTKETLETLRKAYERAGMDFKAAEAYEYQYELYPSTVSLNNIGVLYHNSGNNLKAADFFKLGLEKEPNNSMLHFNLGNTLKYIDNEAYIKHIHKACEINPNNSLALIESGHINRSEGNREEAENELRRAYDILLKDWKTDSLSRVGYGWLSSLAKELGEDEVAEKVRKSEPDLESEKYYDEENLAKERANMLNKY